MDKELLVVGDAPITRHDIISALDHANGSIADAAALLGIRRNELAAHINQDDSLRQFHLDFVEAAIDKAQRNVFKAVEEGNYAASQFLLTTLGKDRGFSTKQELTLAKKEDLGELSEAELKERLRRASDRINTLLLSPPPASDDS